MQVNGRVWGATPSEQSAPYPCDALLNVPYEGWIRAVDVSAPCDLVFRWLQQLTIAPYSYDWIDFRGRRSPDRLTPDLPPPAVGQSFLVFDIAEFEVGRHITGVLPQRLVPRHGQMAVTYAVSPREAGGCRLVVKVDAEARTALRHKVLRRLLAWGDLVMMRKQLLTLKRLAERDAAEARH
ncbi:hypothetical protein [Streptomyces sp. NPDC051776]|uniref:hypothetical protein n=1 Tax=Streptomyces sp. NPDC051776 TaxID=3155414 RepID=UPI00344A3755